MSEYKAYTVAAPREMPAEVLEQFAKIARKMDALGYTVRTGGGDGADDIVAQNAAKIELYLPWKKFNGKVGVVEKPTEEAQALAKKAHPAYDKVKETVQLLIARASHLVLGTNLRDPVKFIVCYSEDGVEEAAKRTAKTGPAGQLITIAKEHNIPIFNLKNGNAMSRLVEFTDF